ncbi:hypothetical protein B566_EDAN008526 [Ephemera danica]|nr:hypothetical protein B566_EDAN008526 [Ephemera danica]
MSGLNTKMASSSVPKLGFRSGYMYRQPLVKSEPPRPRNDVELPPAVSSLGFLLEEEEMYRQGYRRSMGKGHDRTRWLNSPNVYQKVEILETGTPDPKKITKVELIKFENKE